MEDLVANLKKAAAVRIQDNSWMGEATKKAALVKLPKMDVMVGYPDKFRDYSKLEMKPDDLYGNVKRSGAFDWAYQLEDLNKPVDSKKWGMSPATVDAYNGGLENKIVFPAGILQPPFFDPTADAAVNYGAAGAIIGHEIMPRLRRPGTQDRREWGGSRLVDQGGRSPVQGADGRAGQAIFVLRGRAGSVHQRGADDGREYRRHVGPGDCAPGVSNVACTASRRR